MTTMCRNQQLSFEDWLASHDANKGRGYSEASRKVILSIYRTLRASVGGPPEFADADTLLRAVQNLSVTHNYRIRCLGVIATFHEAINESSRSPARLALHRIGEEEIGVARTIDSQLILDFLDRPIDSWRQFRVAIVLRLSFGAGLTLAEILSMTCKQAFLHCNPIMIRVPAHGQRKERIVPLAHIHNQSLVKWIELNSFAQDDFIIPARSGAKHTPHPSTIWREIKRFLDLKNDAAGVSLIRNAFALRQFENDRPVPCIQKWLGHTREFSTENLKKRLPKDIYPV